MPSEFEIEGPLPAPSLIPEEIETIENPYSLTPKSGSTTHEDKIRGYLAIGLTALFAIQVIIAIGGAFLEAPIPANIKDALSYTLSPTLAMAASAVGYYFAAK